MKKFPETAGRIRDLLKKNPHGLNIREIAEQCGINRMSVAKYLDVLMTNGTVDVRMVGNAKVYILSRQIPVTTYLEYTSKHYCITDSDLRVVQLNEWIPQTVGMAYEDFIGRPLLDVLKNVVVNLDDCRVAMEKALAGEATTVVVEENFQGKHMFFEILHMPVQFPDGSHGMMAISQDITDKKRVEIALRENEEKFRGLVENINDIVFSVDTAGIVTYISPRVTKYGYTQEDFIGKHFEAIIYPKDLPIIVSTFLDLMDSGVFIKGVIFRSPAADGRLVWLEGNGMIQQDDAGNYTGINGVLRDITGRVEAEQALQRSRREYDALANTSDGFLSINPDDHRIEYMSERYARRRGSDATGEYCYKALFNRDSVCPGCIAGRAAEGERVVRTMQGRKDGRWYHVVYIPVTRTDGSVSVNIIITELGMESPGPGSSCGPAGPCGTLGKPGRKQKK